MTFKTNLIKTLAVAAVATALPVAAHAAEKGSFSHAGTNYTYEDTVVDGRRVISGTSSEGKPFRLVVRGSAVVGQFNGYPVSFRLSDVKPVAVVLR